MAHAPQHSATQARNSCVRCRGQGSGRYSRLQADVRAMQHNSSTYCDEPEDTTDFQAWLAVSFLPCLCHPNSCMWCPQLLTLSLTLWATHN